MLFENGSLGYFEEFISCSITLFSRSGSTSGSLGLKSSPLQSLPSTSHWNEEERNLGVTQSNTGLEECKHSSKLNYKKSDGNKEEVFFDTNSSWIEIAGKSHWFPRLLHPTAPGESGGLFRLDWLLAQSTKETGIVK